MKTDVTTYGSLLQSQAKATKANPPTFASASKIEPVSKEAAKTAANPDYKVKISKEATEAARAAANPSPSSPLPSLPSLPTSTPTSEAPKVEAPKIDVKDEPKTTDVSAIKVKNGTVKKPAVIFVKGMDVFSSPSTSEGGYAGVGKMAEAVPGAKVFSWNQQEEILKEIKKVSMDQPVILVGHSFGGDTVHEVAEQLDTLENGFRKVSLLITIDSVGVDNDIIPQNVENHLNIFGENDFFLNDGPHVARKHENTKIRNILSPHDHTELDDHKDVQSEVMTMIQLALSKSL